MSTEGKEPPLDLVISLLATKAPSQFGHGRDPSYTSDPFAWYWPDSNYDKERCRNRVLPVLDVLARAVLTDHGQVAAVAASVGSDGVGPDLRTNLYVSLNPGKDLLSEDAIKDHVLNLLDQLRSLTDHDMKGRSETPTNVPFNIHTSFYAFGWKRFTYYCKKRADVLPIAEQRLAGFKNSVAARTFSAEALQHLERTLRWMGVLQKAIDEPADRRAMIMAALVGIEYPRFHGTHLLDGISVQTLPFHVPLYAMYASFEVYLSSEGTHFPIIRWLAKLFSFHLDGQRLMELAASVRFSGILSGDLEITIVCQEPHGGRKIDGSRRTLLQTVVFLRHAFDEPARQGKGSPQLLTDQEIVDKLQDELSSDKNKKQFLEPTMCVHCEIFLLRYIQMKGVPILPYIGVSKLSCVPCSIYFEKLRKAGFDAVSTKGSHGKVCPGWLLPSDTAPNQEDRENLKSLQDIVEKKLQHLLWDYILDVAARRGSDSSVGFVDECLGGLSKGAYKALPPAVQDLFNKSFPGH